MNIKNITFIYNLANDTCLIQKNNQFQELTIKGSTDYQGQINGTWFQLDEKTNHWISFRKDRFQTHKWEVFYQVKDTLTFTFSQKDEWVKIENKWKSKF